MPGSLNKVMIIGNLGRDPDIRTIPSGAKVANFSVATNENYTDRNSQTVERTEWHRIVMWRGLADIAEKYLRKGSTVYIEGKLATRTWDDPNGQKHYTTEVIASQMQMLGAKTREGGDMSVDYQTSQVPQEQFPQPQSNAGSQVESEAKPAGLGPMPTAPEDDLPF